jgi:hypothetical protein
MRRRDIAVIVALFLSQAISACLTAGAHASNSELILTFVTGGDDLRGGRDNVHVLLLLRSGTPLRFDNVNGGKRWPDRSSRTASLPLPDTVRFEDIEGVRLETTFAGGVGGDNWNLDGLTVTARVGSVTRKLFDQQGSPLFRFTGNQRVREFRFSTGNELIVQFATGSDDLRGGNDNVHLFLLLRARAPLRFDNVNGGRRWPDRSSRTVNLPLPGTVRFEDIEGVRLETTFAGGVGGDNWNLDGLTVTARVGSVTRKLFDRRGSPLFRFTRDQRARVSYFGERFDFNLEWSAVSPGGFPLNPRWRWQRDNPGVPSAELCHYFTNNDVPDFADCTNQTDLTMVDTPTGVNEVVCGLETTKGFHGHLNWFAVTFTGTLYFGDHNTDEDYYLALGTPGAPGIISGDKDPPLDVMHTEFNSDETIDNFQTSWWKSFRDAVNTSKERGKEMMKGQDAIMTGLFGVDLEHGGGKSELHPVLALAVNVRDEAAENVWAMFVRNTGNEGYCSHRMWKAEFTTYTFRLPWKEGMSSVEVLTGPDQSQFAGTAGTSGPAVVFTPGQGVDVTFTLPPPSQTPLVEGELHLRWVGQPPIATARRPVPRLERVAEHDEVGPVREAIDRLPPAQRRQVEEAREAAHPRILKLHGLPPVAAARQVRELAAPPAAAVRLGTKGDVATRKIARDAATLRALCKAWNGSPPGLPPDFCRKVGGG